MKKSIDEKMGTVSFTFGEGVAPVVFHTDKASAENRAYAVLHGFAARLGDNAAIVKSKENNYVVTETMRREAVLELVNHYESGSAQWNIRAAGPRAPTINPTWAAIAAKRGMTYEKYCAERVAKDLEELAMLGLMPAAN